MSVEIEQAPSPQRVRLTNVILSLDSLCRSYSESEDNWFRSGMAHQGYDLSLGTVEVFKNCKTKEQKLAFYEASLNTFVQRSFAPNDQNESASLISKLKIALERNGWYEDWIELGLAAAYVSSRRTEHGSLAYDNKTIGQSLSVIDGDEEIKGRFVRPRLEIFTDRISNSVLVQGFNNLSANGIDGVDPTRASGMFASGPKSLIKLARDRRGAELRIYSKIADSPLHELRVRAFNDGKVYQTIRCIKDVELSDSFKTSVIVDTTLSDSEIHQILGNVAFRPGVQRGNILFLVNGDAGPDRSEITRFGDFDSGQELIGMVSASVSHSGITVSDTGVGMSKEQLFKLFIPRQGTNQLIIPTPQECCSYVHDEGYIETAPGSCDQPEVLFLRRGEILQKVVLDPKLMNIFPRETRLEFGLGIKPVSEARGQSGFAYDESFVEAFKTLVQKTLDTNSDFAGNVQLFNTLLATFRQIIEDTHATESQESTIVSHSILLIREYLLDQMSDLMKSYDIDSQRVLLPNAGIYRDIHVPHGNQVFRVDSAMFERTPLNYAVLGREIPPIMGVKTNFGFHLIKATLKNTEKMLDFAGSGDYDRIFQDLYKNPVAYIDEVNKLVFVDHRIWQTYEFYLVAERDGTLSYEDTLRLGLLRRALMDAMNDEIDTQYEDKKKVNRQVILSPMKKNGNVDDALERARQSDMSNEFNEMGFSNGLSDDEVRERIHEKLSRYAHILPEGDSRMKASLLRIHHENEFAGNFKHTSVFTYNGKTYCAVRTLSGLSVHALTQHGLESVPTWEYRVSKDQYFDAKIVSYNGAVYVWEVYPLDNRREGFLKQLELDDRNGAITIFREWNLTLSEGDRDFSRDFDGFQPFMEDGEFIYLSAFDYSADTFWKLHKYTGGITFYDVKELKRNGDMTYVRLRGGTIINGVPVLYISYWTNDTIGYLHRFVMQEDGELVELPDIEHEAAQSHRLHIITIQNKQYALNFSQTATLDLFKIDHDGSLQLLQSLSFPDQSDGEFFNYKLACQSGDILVLEKGAFEHDSEFISFRFNSETQRLKYVNTIVGLRYSGTGDTANAVFYPFTEANKNYISMFADSNMFVLEANKNGLQWLTSVGREKELLELLNMLSHPGLRTLPPINAQNLVQTIFSYSISVGTDSNQIIDTLKRLIDDGWLEDPMSQQVILQVNALQPKENNHWMYLHDPVVRLYQYYLGGSRCRIYHEFEIVTSTSALYHTKKQVMVVSAMQIRGLDSYPFAERVEVYQILNSLTEIFIERDDEFIFRIGARLERARCKGKLSNIVKQVSNAIKDFYETSRNDRNDMLLENEFIRFLTDESIELEDEGEIHIDENVRLSIPIAAYFARTKGVTTYDAILECIGHASPGYIKALDVSEYANDWKIAAHFAGGVGVEQREIGQNWDDAIRRRKALYNDITEGLVWYRWFTAYVNDRRYAFQEVTDKGCGMSDEALVAFGISGVTDKTKYRTIQSGEFGYGSISEFVDADVVMVDTVRYLPDGTKGWAQNIYRVVRDAEGKALEPVLTGSHRRDGIDNSEEIRTSISIGKDDERVDAEFDAIMARNAARQMCWFTSVTSKKERKDKYRVPIRIFERKEMEVGRWDWSEVVLPYTRQVSVGLGKRKWASIYMGDGSVRSQVALNGRMLHFLEPKDLSHFPQTLRSFINSKHIVINFCGASPTLDRLHMDGDQESVTLELALKMASRLLMKGVYKPEGLPTDMGENINYFSTIWNGSMRETIDIAKLLNEGQSIEQVMEQIQRSDIDEFNTLLISLETVWDHQRQSYLLQKMVAFFEAYRTLLTSNPWLAGHYTADYQAAEDMLQYVASVSVRETLDRIHGTDPQLYEQLWDMITKSASSDVVDVTDEWRDKVNFALYANLLNPLDAELHIMRHLLRDNASRNMWLKEASVRYNDQQAFTHELGHIFEVRLGMFGISSSSYTHQKSRKIGYGLSRILAASYVGYMIAAGQV